MPGPGDHVPGNHQVLTRLTLVRHGHVHNPCKILYGRLPGFHLSPEGIRQARSMAYALRNRPLSAVFSSPLLRARQTAAHILYYHQSLKLRISKHLTEVYTPYQGRASSEVAAMGGDLYTGSQTPFEQPRDIVNRLLKFMAKIRSRHRGQEVVAVTHGDTITFALLWARGLPLDPAYKEDLTKAGITDRYPATASMTTFIFRAGGKDERPEVEYARSNDKPFGPQF